jgi:hypothetical protein
MVDDIIGQAQTTVIISLVGTFLLIALSFFFVRRYMNKVTGGTIKGGEMAQATIVRIWDTGTTVNGNPVVGFLLDVQRQAYPTYQAETKSMIPRLMVSQFQPGAVVPVKLDPQNPAQVALNLYA